MGLRAASTEQLPEGPSSSRHLNSHLVARKFEQVCTDLLLPPDLQFTSTFAFRNTDRLNFVSSNCSVRSEGNLELITSLPHTYPPPDTVNPMEALFLSSWNFNLAILIVTGSLSTALFGRSKDHASKTTSCSKMSHHQSL